MRDTLLAQKVWGGERPCGISPGELSPNESHNSRARMATQPFRHSPSRQQHGVNLGNKVIYVTLHFLGNDLVLLTNQRRRAQNCAPAHP
jgi:hypothetical protein